MREFAFANDFVHCCCVVVADGVRLLARGEVSVEISGQVSKHTQFGKSTADPQSSRTGARRVVPRAHIHHSAGAACGAVRVSGVTQNEFCVRIFRTINKWRETPRDYLQQSRAEGGHVWIVTYPKSGVARRANQPTKIKLSRLFE